MVTAVAAFASVGAGVHHSPAYQFFLHLHEDFLWNNRFMVTFHIVLRDGAIVFDSGFAEEVDGVALLQQCITDVFLVSPNFVDGAYPPFGLPCAGENTVSHGPGGNLAHVAFHVLPVDALGRFGLLRVDDKVSVCILGIAEEMIAIDLNVALLVAILQAQLNGLTHGLALLLGQRGHNGK